MSITYHTVGMKKNGSMVAVGNNTNGQCNVTTWTDIIQVSCGGSHTVGLKRDGTCIGIGYASAIKDLQDWRDIIQISCGYDNTIGLKKDGTCVACGSEMVNIDISLLTDIKQVALSRYNAIGLKADGTCVAVGNNEYNQLNVTDWTDIKQVACGTIFNIGLKKDGTCLAVGYKDDGQLDVTGWTDIIQVACGGSHTVGLKKDGTCLAVGSNGQGQCNVNDWTDIVQVSCGSQFTVGLKSDGTVLFCGNSSDSKSKVSEWENISNLMSCHTVEFPRLTKDFVVKNGLNYISYNGEYFRLQSTINYTDKYFLPKFLQQDIDIRKDLYSSDTTKSLVNYNLSQFKYDKTDVISVNSVVCNHKNGKFLLRDGVKLYSLNPLNYLHDGNPNDAEIETYGVSEPKLTKEELSQLSLDVMFIVAHTESITDEQYIIVNETLDRNFISVLAHEPNFKMYMNKNEYNGVLEINGSKLSPYTCQGYFEGSQITNIENTTEDIKGSTFLKSSLFTTSENPYNFNIKITQDNEKIIQKTTKLLLANREPQIILNMTGMYLKIDLGDDDGNKVKYNIYVNGSKIYPITEEWSPLVQTPFVTTKRFKSNEIIVEGENLVKVNVIDEYGKSTSLTYKFIGECSGLLFMNEHNEMYTDDLGNIIRMLEFGNILAGKSSKIEKIKLKNNCGFNVKDITIKIEPTTIPQGSTILLDTDFDNFRGSNEINIQRLVDGAEIEFYIRVITDIEQETGGTFDITVTSTSDFS